MLTALIEKRFGQQHCEFKSKLFEYSVRYCVRSINAFEYQKLCTLLFAKHNVRYSSKDFRLELCNSSWFLLNFKFFCMSFTLNKLSLDKNRDKLKLCVKEYGVNKQDFLNFIKFLKDKANKRSLKLAFDCYSRHDIISIHSAKKRFGKMYPDLMHYCKSITFRKLRFILKSNNMCADDMQCELMTKALRSFYSIIPSNETDLYILNYLKRTVHNHAMNIIKKFTFVKRDRLKNINNGKDFQLKIVSENQFKPNSNSEYGSIDTVGVATDYNYERFEVARTYIQLYRQADKKKRILLRLIMGEYDEDFTKFLHKTHLIGSKKTNVHYYELDIKTYKEQVFSYLQIPNDVGQNYLERVYAQHFGA